VDILKDSPVLGRNLVFKVVILEKADLWVACHCVGRIEDRRRRWRIIQCQVTYSPLPVCDSAGVLEVRTRRSQSVKYRGIIIVVGVPIYLHLVDLSLRKAKVGTKLSFECKSVKWVRRVHQHIPLQVVGIVIETVPRISVERSDDSLISDRVQSNELRVYFSL